MRYLAFEESTADLGPTVRVGPGGAWRKRHVFARTMGFDIVDINFGCPVNKVVKCNGGSGLLRDLPLIETILTTVRKAITIPLTCKFRAGWNDQELVFAQMAKLAEDCGLQAVALHPRTREQGYSGKADWTRIAERQSSGEDSGDRQWRHSYSRRRGSHGGADGLRCGNDRARGVFESMDLCAASGVPGDGKLSHPMRRERYELMRRYYNLLVERGEPDAIGKMKQFATYFTHGIRNGSKLRTEIYQTKETAEVLERVDAFFSRELEAAVA